MGTKPIRLSFLRVSDRVCISLTLFTTLILMEGTGVIGKCPFLYLLDITLYCAAHLLPEIHIGFYKFGPETLKKAKAELKQFETSNQDGR